MSLPVVPVRMVGADRRPTAIAGLEALAGIVIAAIIAGIALGALLSLTGRIESVAGLYGTSGTVDGWLLVFAFSVLAGIGFAVLTAIVSLSRLAAGTGNDSAPGVVVTSAGLGAVYGLVLWGVIVAVGIPIWMDYAMAGTRPFPYLHQVSLVGLVGFGMLFAAWYAFVRELLGRSESGADPSVEGR